MKRYEGIKREESAVFCPKCGEEIGFADMTCSHCGADARTDPRSYKPRLSSYDIQPRPRERVGGPHEPKGDYSFKAINNISFILTFTALIFAVIIGIITGNALAGTLWGVLAGILAAAVLMSLAWAVGIQLKNTAKSAHTGERIALGIEYQIEQLNELITTYNKDKSIDADNAEVFAKLLVKMNKMEEAQKNTLVELTNIVGAISRKLNKNAERMTLNEVLEEIDFDDDFDDDEAAQETAETADGSEDTAAEEATGTLEEASDTDADIEADADKDTREAEEGKSVEETPEEAPAENEEDILTIPCPRCGANIVYDEEQLQDGAINIVCEECGTEITLEIEDEETDDDPDKDTSESEVGDDAQTAYERAFGNDEPISSSSLTSRLDAFLDDEDDD